MDGATRWNAPRWFVYSSLILYWSLHCLKTINQHYIYIKLTEVNSTHLEWFSNQSTDQWYPRASLVDCIHRTADLNYCWNVYTSAINTRWNQVKPLRRIDLKPSVEMPQKINTHAYVLQSKQFVDFPFSNPVRAFLRYLMCLGRRQQSSSML